jgi:competence protein ComFC
MPIISVIDHFVDFIFPRNCISCGSLLQKKDMLVCCRCLAEIKPITKPFCRHCGTYLEDGGEFCWFCRRNGQKHIDMVRSCCVYEGVARKIVQKYKFHNRDFIDIFIAGIMAARFKEFFQEERVDLVVPAPMHWLKKAFRGYNQSELLANKLAGMLNIEYGKSVLKRRFARSQIGLKRKDRLQNVLNTVLINNKAAVLDKNVLVIDDVCTTASTLNECAKVLKEAGAKIVFGYTFAHD